MSSECQKRTLSHSAVLQVVTVKLPKLKLTVKKYAALAFLKHEDVELGWIHIHSHDPLNVKMTELLDYFVGQ